jgi:effector-binding domain-containing protein
VASLTTHTGLRTIGEDIGRGFATLMGAIGAASAQVIGSPFIVYHDVIDEQTDGTIEICAPVPPGVHAAGNGVQWKEMPGGSVACTVHRGPYGEIGPAYHTLMGWIQEHGHQVSGAPREVYLNDPQTVAPEDLLTEIQFPIQDPES